MSGVPAKVMCHIGGVADRALMTQILDLLRPGDILTHCYSGAPNIAGDGTNIVQDGKLLPAALAAKRGVSRHWPRRQLGYDRRGGDRKGARPTRSRRTSTCSRATRRGCRTCLGDEQVDRHGFRWPRSSPWSRPRRRGDRAPAQARDAEPARKADLIDPRGVEGRGRVRRYPQQQAHRQDAPAAGRRGRRRRRSDAVPVRLAR